MKKILCIILAVLTLLSCMLTMSCNMTEGDENGTGDITVSTDGDTTKTLTVPDELDYNKKEFNIIGCSDWGVEEFTPENVDMRDQVSASLVARDNFLKEYLNVDIKIERIKGQFNDRLTFAQTIENAVLSDAKAYDLVACYSLVAPSLATRGLLVDLNKTEYFSPDKAWWPDFMYDACTVNNKTYHISGDASLNMLYYLQAVLFDAEIMAEYDISEEDVYELVDNGGWTLEKMLELSANISSSTDDVWDDSDFYAIGMESRVMLDSFYFALGLKTVEDSDGVIKVSDDILSEKALTVYDMAYSALFVDHTIRMNDPNTWVHLLKEGRCVFNVSTIYQMKTTLADVDKKIGVLPFPKYEEGDTETNLGYRTLVSSPHIQFAIPVDLDSEDVTMASAFLETMGYVTYTNVTPVVYDNIMKLRYAKDENSSRMFDILRSGATTEMGILWYNSFTRAPASMFRNALEKESTSWVSYYKNDYENDLKRTVIELNKFYMQ